MNRILLIAILTVALVAGTLLALDTDRAGSTASAAAPRVATVLPEPQTLPEFSLTDHTGTERDRSVLEGQWNLVFFGFTHCPDICPTTLATLSSARKELAQANAAGTLPRIVLVSVDPERDTPEKLAEYIGYFGEGNLALTGPEASIRELTEPLFVYFNRVPLENGSYTVDHSSVVLLIDPEGRFHSLFSGPHNVADFVHDLPIVTSRT